MKLLHTSDWHLGKSLFDFPLLEDQSAFLDWLLLELERREIGVLLLSGDLYDRPVPGVEAIRLFDRFLSRAVIGLGVKVLAVAGNHDSKSRLEFGSSLCRESGYFVAGETSAELARVTLWDEWGPVDFHLLPYLHPAEVRALLPDQPIPTFDAAYKALLAHNIPRMDRSRRNILLAHGFFADLGAGAEILISDSEVHIGGMDIADSVCFSPFNYAALGHLHTCQQAGHGGYYSGAPLKYSLSEEQRTPCCLLVELGEKGAPVVERLTVPAARGVRTVRGSFEQLLEPSFHHEGGFGDYVFAVIDGPEVIYPMEKLRTLFPNLLGLRFGSDSDSSALPHGPSQDARLSPEELFCRFYRELKGREIPPEQLELVREAIAGADRGEEEL